MITGGLILIPVVQKEGFLPPWWAGAPFWIAAGAAVLLIPRHPGLAGAAAAVALIPAVWILLEWWALAEYMVGAAPTDCSTSRTG